MNEASIVNKVRQAAAALERLGLWSGARAEDELAAYRELAARHGAGRLA